MPLSFNSVVTSVNVEVLLLMVYFEELLRYAVRVTMSVDFGTTSKASSSGFTTCQRLIRREKIAQNSLPGLLSLGTRLPRCIEEYLPCLQSCV